jgi:hypothetical protein
MAGERKSEIDEHLELLKQAANVSEPASSLRGVTKEAAILNTLAARDVRLHIRKSAKELNARLDALSARLDAFTIATNEGTERLSRWTKWLAIVTAGLVFAALLQAWVMWSAAPQLIVVPFGRP